jgi:hypothetical protein
VTATPSFSDTGPTGATLYRDQVRATDAAANVGPHRRLRCATLTPPDTQAPTAPECPQCDGDLGDGVDLT